MRKHNKHTVGIDLGDCRHEVCAIDDEGEVAETKRIGSDRDALQSLAKKYPKKGVIIECGAQSPWIRRFLAESGMEKVPTDQHHVIESVVKVLAATTAEIKEYENIIAEAAERHPVAKRLQQVVGIGPVTALYFRAQDRGSGLFRAGAGHRRLPGIVSEV